MTPADAPLARWHFDSAAYLSSKFKLTGRRSFREALLRLEEGEAFINAGQSGADGGAVVVQLIMTLAAQLPRVSVRNEGIGGVHILWMSCLFVVRCAALWMPCSENQNKALQTVRFCFSGENGGGGWPCGAAVDGVISGNAFSSLASAGVTTCC